MVLKLKMLAFTLVLLVAGVILGAEGELARGTPVHAAGTPVVTRYFQALLITPNQGWNLVPLDQGVPSMPWQGNTLLSVDWSVTAVTGTAPNVLLHVALGPQGHPGGGPVMIFGDEIAAVSGVSQYVKDRSQVWAPAPIDLAAFFGGGTFSGQPLEGQVEVESEGGSGTISSVLVMLTVVSTV